MELSIAASTSASHDSVVMIANKFHPLSHFCFRNACLDRRMRNVHSGQNGVRNTAGYIMILVLTLHFVICICMKAKRLKKYKASTKYDPAFISKSCKNWKEATVAFNKHLKSDCHKEAIEVHELPKKTGDIGEKLSSEHKNKKELTREMFRRILQNICYLTIQALPLRGHDDDVNSNSMQLLCLFTSF